MTTPFVSIHLPTNCARVILLLGTRAETLARIDRWRVQRRRQMKDVGGVFMILLGIATYYWVFLSVTKL